MKLACVVNLSILVHLVLLKMANKILVVILILVNTVKDYHALVRLPDV